MTRFRRLRRIFLGLLLAGFVLAVWAFVAEPDLHIGSPFNGLST
ncbi:MAG TPA: hypothetical protein VGX68_08010 [Thermoanaerobaculia bacterium]|jgi:hypothetical protein|nr:hypothetical protein [Thermoanaerobaculia bacterium]